MPSRVLVLAMAVWSAFGVAAAARAEMQTRTIHTGGAARTYLLYVPNGVRTPGGLPLVVMMHGGGGMAEQMVRFSRFNAIAAREQFAVAYPQGLRRSWNDGRVFRGRDTDVDDVGFIRALVADIGANVAPLDRRRIFATGISNGGFMSFRLACEAADLFAAIAPVTAQLSENLGARCSPSRPVALLVINGTADPLVPYEGGHVRVFVALRGAIWSTERTLAFWAQHNRCALPPSVRVLPDRDPGDGSTVIEADYRCAGAPVRLLRVEGGGHTWPGGIQYLPVGMVGTTNRDIDASEVIWTFFKSAVR